LDTLVVKLLKTEVRGAVDQIVEWLAVPYLLLASVLVVIQLEDFSLDKSVDYSDVTCEGKFHQEGALLLLSTFEVRCCPSPTLSFSSRYDTLGH
jgi:hypothetical protein